MYNDPELRQFCAMLLINAIALKMLKVLDIAVARERLENVFRQRVDESAELIHLVHDKNGGTSRIGASWGLASGILRILDECVSDFTLIIDVSGRTDVHNVMGGDKRDTHATNMNAGMNLSSNSTLGDKSVRKKENALEEQNNR